MHEPEYRSMNTIISNLEVATADIALAPGSKVHMP